MIARLLAEPGQVAQGAVVAPIDGGQQQILGSAVVTTQLVDPCEGTQGFGLAPGRSVAVQRLGAVEIMALFSLLSQAQQDSCVASIGCLHSELLGGGVVSFLLFPQGEQLDRAHIAEFRGLAPELPGLTETTGPRVLLGQHAEDVDVALVHRTRDDRLQAFAITPRGAHARQQVERARLALLSRHPGQRLGTRMIAMFLA